jgi:hypothetical protein
MLEKIKEFGFNFLMVDQENSSQIHIENKEGYRTRTTIGKILSGKNQFKSIAHPSNPYSLYNINLFIKKNKMNFYLLENNTYTSATDKNLKCYCYECQDIFLARWQSISTFHGCGLCNGKQVGVKNLKTQRPDLIKEWSNNNANLPESYSEFSHSEVLWRCSVCGNEWADKISNRTNLDRGCKKCSMSKGEKRIFQFIKSFNLKFSSEYSEIPSVKNGKLRFDFYLSDYNLFIEYHGIQHYEPIDFAGKGKEWAKNQFKENQRRDKIKEKYCYHNDINLLIIPYWDYDNIEKILEETLQELERS